MKAINYSATHLTVNAVRFFAICVSWSLEINSLLPLLYTKASKRKILLFKNNEKSSSISSGIGN